MPVDRDAAYAQRLLRRLLARAQYTSIGRTLGFSDLLRAPDVGLAWRDAVPVQPYAVHAPYIDRALAGEPDVLWPGVIRHFAVSSGTTSAGKRLPRSVAHLRLDARFGLKAGLGYVARYKDWGVLGGAHLTMPGHIEPLAGRPEAWVGEVSGLVAAQAPTVFRRVFQAVSEDALRAGSWASRLTRIAQEAVRRDVRAIAMVPSWTHVFAECVREVVRAQTGRRVQTLKEVWPNLRLFISGGVALSAYRDALPADVGLGVRYLETYGASEGFFSYQTDLNDPAMRLDVRAGVVLEFLPESGAGRRIPLEEVEVGQRYVPVVTTCSGLWAYPVGDVLTFTSVRPYVLRVMGRTAEVLDRYGEAVYAADVEAALAEACVRAGGHLANYHVTSRFDEARHRPVHEWYVAFVEPPTSPDAWMHAADAALCSRNRHYAIRRDSGAMLPPVLHPVHPTQFVEALHTLRNRVGMQTKVPRLQETPTFAEALLRT